MAVESATATTNSLDISIVALQQSHLLEADRIMKLAFGTFLNLPEPASFLGDADYVKTRWQSDRDAAFGATVGDELVGSNFATNWGSVGFFGPLTVRPDLWDRGVGKRLIEAAVDCFEQRNMTHTGLFTFPQSQKHVRLYQKFGFWARFLTPIMSKPVATSTDKVEWTRFSQVAEGDCQLLLSTCRQLTDTIYEGLDLAAEISAVASQNLGDTVLLWNDGKLIGFAICHYGAGTEAGSGVCFIKFGATRPSPTAERDFNRLLDACERMAAKEKLSRLVAGVNTARHEAYCQMLDRGFRTELQGVAMQKNNEPGYNRSGVYVIDDWR